MPAAPSRPTRLTMASGCRSRRGWLTVRRWSTPAATGRTGRAIRPIPAQLSDGAEQAVWAVSLSGGAPRRLGPGNAPTPAPKESVVAWISRGQIFTSDLAAGDAKPTRLVAARGTASSLRWSPDGAALAFVSNRGTHSFLGLVTLASRELRYLDPSLDRDSNPAWSPDGTRLAYTRELAAPRPQMFAPRRTADEPWTIRVVDVKTGGAREVWKADPGYGSVLQPIDAENQILWAAGRSARVPVGEVRLAAPLQRAGGGRRGGAAFARRR